MNKIKIQELESTVARLRAELAEAEKALLWERSKFKEGDWIKWKYGNREIVGTVENIEAFGQINGMPGIRWRVVCAAGDTEWRGLFAYPWDKPRLAKKS